MQASAQSGAGWNGVWEEVFAGREWGKYPPEYVVRFVMRAWGASADRRKVRILDLGSGPGANTWFLAREGFDAVAIDGSTSAIRRLRERLAGEGLQAEAIVGDYAQTSWPDSSFDGVLDIASLCHNPMAHSKRCVREVLRLLKPSGLFFSAAFTESSWGNGLGVEVEPGGFTEVTEGPIAGCGFARFLSREQIDELYSGFAELHIERFEWSLCEMRQIVQMWLITCRKG